MLALYEEEEDRDANENYIDDAGNECCWLCGSISGEPCVAQRCETNISNSYHWDDKNEDSDAHDMELRMVMLTGA